LREVAAFIVLVTQNTEVHCEATMYNFLVLELEVIKSRRTRWAGHVARMGEKRGGV